MSDKNMLVVKIIVLSVVSVFLLVFMIYAIKVGSGVFHFGSAKSYELQFSEEYSLDSFKNISFDLSSANLQVLESDSNIVKLEIYDEKKDTFDVEIKNNTLFVNIKKNFKFFNICIGFCGFEGKRVVVYLPSDFDGNISSNGASGDIRVDDFDLLSGSLTTVSGDVVVGSMKEANVKTTSGDVAINNSDNVSVSTTSGDINISNVPKVKFKTTSGDIQLNNVGDIDGKSVSGELEVINMIGEFQFSTTSGDVDMNHAELIRNSSISTVSGDVEVKLVKGVYVEASTTSGDKDILNNDRYSEVTLRISTVSGDIEVD